MAHEYVEFVDVDGDQIVFGFSNHEFVVYENGAAVSRHALGSAQLEADSSNSKLHVFEQGRHLLTISVARGHELSVARILGLFSQAVMIHSSSLQKENVDGGLLLQRGAQTRNASPGSKASATSPGGRVASKKQRASPAPDPSASPRTSPSNAKLALRMAQLNEQADWARDFLGKERPPCAGQDLSRQASKVENGRKGSKDNGSRKPSKTKSWMEKLTNEEAAVHDEGTSGDESKPAPMETTSRQPSKRGVVDLARSWDIPLDTLKSGSELFKMYAQLPRRNEREDILNDGFLSADAMTALVLKILDKSSLDDLSPEERREMIAADTNGDGVFDFREFSAWYEARAFLDCFNLSKEEIEIRDIGRRLGLTAMEMDHYKVMYDKFDTDGSGDIDFEEFGDLIHILMKIDGDDKLPHSRILNFWHECDADGSGEVDLEEFITFHLKHFDVNAEDPLTDFYKSQRFTGHWEQ